MKEKDKILIYLKDNSHQFISDVYYAPDIKSNILSFTTTERAFVIIFLVTDQKLSQIFIFVMKNTAVTKEVSICVDFFATVQKPS